MFNLPTDHVVSDPGIRADRELLETKQPSHLYFHSRFKSTEARPLAFRVDTCSSTHRLPAKFGGSLMAAEEWHASSLRDVAPWLGRLL